MDDTLKMMMALFRYALGERPAVPEEIAAMLTPESAKHLFLLSYQHNLTHLVADALESAGLYDRVGSEAKSYFHRSKLFAIYRYEKRKYEFDRICAALEAAQIPYIPLKGAVLQALWPEPWMRTCHDIDILVRYDTLSAAKEQILALGFHRRNDSNHDITFVSPEGVILELHHSMLDKTRDSAAATQLESIWEHAAPVGDGFAYQLDVSMFLFLHLAHMVEHLERGGCGIRLFLDLWLLHRTGWLSQNREGQDELLQQGGLEQFYAASMRLVMCWMEEKPADQNTLVFQDFVVNGGLYGNLSNRIAVQSVKDGSTWKYVTSRLFWPYKRLEYVYPILHKHKWLLPVMQVRRWVSRISERGMKFFVDEFRMSGEVTSSMPAEQKEKLLNMWAYLGLE